MNTSTKICISALIISALLLFTMLLLAIPYSKDYKPKAAQNVTAEKADNSGVIKPTKTGQAICPNLGENLFKRHLLMPFYISIKEKERND